MRILFLAVSFLIGFCLVGCDQAIKISTGDIRSISGKIQGFSTSSHFLSIAKKSKASANDLNALSCNSPTASLYKINSSGDRIEPALASTSVSDDGSYVFPAKSLGLSFDQERPKSALIVMVSGCSSGVYSRPITSSKNQDVSMGSTLIGNVLNIDKKDKIVNALLSDSVKVEELIKKLGSASSLDGAYAILSGDTEASSGFQDLFDTAPSALLQAVPEVFSVDVPAIGQERTAIPLSVVASHWISGYQMAYEWKIDNQLIAQIALYNFVSNGNFQGNHNVSLVIGENDGTGRVDTAKPYKTINKAITITNTVLPVSPSFSVTSPMVVGTTPINSRALVVSIETGTDKVNCDSLATFAITENTTTTPLLSAFTTSCDTAGLQNLNYVLTSSNDGEKILRLWSKDSAGAISQVPSEFTLNLDTAVPVISISTTPLAMSKSATQTFAFSGNDNGGVIDHYECQIDSAGWQACSSPKAYSGLTEGDHTFYARAMDTAGNFSNVASKSWHIDLTIPTLTLSGSPNTITNSLSAVFNFNAMDSGGAGIASYFCKLDSGSYVLCSAVQSYVVAVGTHVLKAYVVDGAGNSSAELSYSWTIDTTPPTVSITAKPTVLNNATTANFSFTGVDTGGGGIASFLCSIDGSVFGACSSPSTYSSLVQGSHSFAVKAVDTAGNVSNVQTYNWTLDTTAPTLSITSKPAALVDSGPASFSFSATDSGGGTVSGYQCKVDSGAYASCTSPKVVTGLLEGNHTFYVVASDSVGNVSAEESYTWAVDTTAPAVTISSSPSSITNATTASFSFSATDSGGGSVASYLCKIDAGSFAACTSPQGYSSLVEGTHVFSVKATDSVGNVGTIATYSWNVDTTAPTVSITSKPVSLTNSSTANFVFSGSDTGGGNIAGFECALDAGAYSSCTSPLVYTSLTADNHTFSVRPVDTAGNVGSSATYAWTIDMTTPMASINSGPNSITNSTGASFSFSATPPPGGSITGYECSLDGAAWGSCASPKSYAGLAQGSHTFQVRSIDDNNNASSSSSQTWVVDLTNPAVTITSQPSSVVGTTSASFVFNATDAGGGAVASFQCKLDAGSYASCSSPMSYSSLIAGSHTFSVIVFDTAGNQSSAQAVSWTVDLVGPSTTMSTSPNAVTNSTSASLTFNATDSGGGTVGGYYCKIDSGSFVSCTSPQSYSSLSVGSHVFQVYAVDSVGNIGSTVSSSWMIDTTAPTINISSTPSSMTNATTASFSFSATDTGGGSVASYQCKLDAGSYQSCISPQSYSSLGAGNHTFSVTATDTAGNTSTAATYSWSLDLTSPTVTITANPTSLNNATSGSFSFSATDSGGGSIASYQCKLDSNLYSACSSPSNVSGLSQGAHTYYVTATDTAGNNSVAATYTWTTDLTAPTLSLTANPALLTNATTASFSFSAVDTGGGSVANFKCSLDGGAAATCTSPASYSSLAAGGHNFAIYTTDTAGNISATTTYSWTVDLTAPTLSITSKPNAVTNATTASFAFNATDSGGGSIASYQCKVDAGSYTTCTSPQAYSSLAAGSHTFSVTATDTAGNTSAASTYSWTIDLTAPTLTITTPSTNGTVVTLASLTSYVLGGACSENGVSVSLTGSLTATASCLSGSWSTSVDLSGLSDGTLSVTASQTDVAGNTGSSTARTFVKDTVAPTISITTPVAFKGGSSTGAVSWAMTEPYASATNFTVEIFNGSVWSTVGSKVATAGANSNQAYSLSGFAVPAVEVNNAKLRISVSDAAGNSKTQESGVFPIDSTPPVLSSIIINDGDQYAGTTLVSVKVNLTDNNFSGTNLKVRLAQANAGTTDCQSEYADNNWQTWTSSSTNIPFTIVPTDGIKKICVWGKDLVGNVSVISPSTGTSDVTYDTIEFSTGNIPVISGFSVTNGSGGYIALKDDPLTITWSSTDTEGLDNNPVTISYTTDNTVWKDIFTNQDISIPANKTWFGGLSGHPTSGSGTVTTFNAPSSNYFKVKIQAKDLAGNTSSIVSSQTFNTGNWSVYTGVTDRGDGGTGKGAALYGSTQASPFTINPKTGDIYAVDGKLGIRKLDAKTGIVSTIIKYGGTNLPDNGFLNASSAINIGTYTALFFDSNGLLYLSVNMTGYEVIIYQINLDTNAVLKYAGGGTSYDGGVAATSLRLSGSSAFSFDEQNSLYLAVYCNGVSISNDTDLIAAPIRLIKIAQNSNGTPGTTTRILGDCTTSSTITNGADAYSAPMINDYSTLYGILPFNNGNTILLLPYSKKTKTYKIINGKTYTASINTFPTAGMTYNPDDGYVYKLTSAGIEKVLINTAGADGDTATTIFSSNSSAIGCSADGTLNTNYCGSLLTTPVVRQGILYFADGGGVNAYGDYSIRYFDSSGKLQTIFGGKPFNGHDLDRSLVRGSFAGIYYKKASEPNQTAFPAGLYFMDRYGMVFGYIDPNTNITKNLWGNQSTRVASWAEGTVISKDLNMSNPYAGGEGWPLTFDNTGLPWLRVAGNAIKIDADNKIVKKTKSLTTPMLQLAPNGANPVNYGLNYYSGTHNFALKNDGLFAMPNFVNVPAGSDPIISIRYMDFSLLTTPIILGGIFKSSDVMAASPDISTAGQVAAAPLWTNCRGVGICFMQYDSPNDRLYFSEGTKMRYISKPDNTSAATLGTLFTAVSQIANFALTPDGSQMWYFRTNGGLYCHKITSTKTWCDDTTDHFSIRATAGFTFSPGADQITFKDNQTMFLSTYSGQILQFTLPTTP